MSSEVGGVSRKCLHSRNTVALGKLTRQFTLRLIGIVTSTGLFKNRPNFKNKFLPRSKCKCQITRKKYNILIFILLMA
jgi:hypothetical protein